jgi:hypothetical protein
MKKLSVFALILASVCAYSQTVHTVPNLDSNNAFTGTNQFTKGATLGPVTFANIGTLATVPGAVAIISDGSPGTTCSGGGTGVIAVYLNGAWNCAASGLTVGQGLQQVGGTIGLISCPSGQAPQSTGTGYACAPSGGGGGGGNTTAGSTQGQVPAWDVGSALFAPQTKAVIDVRDRGVKCDGVTDDGPALNTLFTAISGHQVNFPETCQIRTSVQIVIQGQSSFVLHGNGDRSFPTGLVGPVIFGCNAAASGPVLYINRSGYGTVEGLSILPRGNTSPCNTSTFTQSIQVDSIGNPGVTTHDLVFDHLALSTGSGTITNYRGISVTDGGKQNGEMIRVKNSWIHCQNSAGSIGVNISNATSDIGVVSDNVISGCFQGIFINGNTRVVSNLLTSNGNFSVFGSGGGAIRLDSCSSGPINILYNEEDSGGQFINSANDAGGGVGCTGGVNVIGNDIGISDYDTANVYPINLGTATASYVVAYNQANLTQTPAGPLVGSKSQGTSGPQGTIYLGMNTLQNSNGTVFGWCCQSPGFQLGSYEIGAAGLHAIGPVTKNQFDELISGATANKQGTVSAQHIFRSNSGGITDDWTLQNLSPSNSSSTFLIGHTKGVSTNNFVAVDGSFSGLSISGVSAPGTPTVTPTGATGSTSYSYAVVAITSTGSVPSSTGSTTTGVLSLSSTQYNSLIYAASPGATGYDIYRTVGGATQGKIAHLPGNASNFTSTVTGYTADATCCNNAFSYTFNDTGFAGDSTSPPVGNTTGKLKTAASTTDTAGFNLPHGVAPTVPGNGDLWTTTSGLFARINGATVGPFGTTAAPAGTDGQLVLMNNSGGFKVVTGLLYDSTNGLQLPLPYQVTSAFPGSSMGTAPDASHSSIGVDTDGKFKVSESGGAVTELAKVNSSITGNAATATNIAGSPTASQYYGTNGSSVKGFYNLPGSSSCHYNAIPGASDQISTATAFATTVSVPNSCIGVGSLITIRAHGVYTTTSTASPTFQLQISAGGTTGICPAAANTTILLTVTNGYWDATCHIQINTTGGPGTAIAWGQYSFAGASGGNATLKVFPNASTGTVSYTTTSSQTASIGITSTPVAGQTWNLTAIDVQVTN